MTAPLEIVFVCTGNRFRSALAEAVFRACAPPDAVRTHSYGTLDDEGVPALGEAGAEAERLGVDISAHRSRSVARADVSRADLVVGFERHHGVAAVVDAGARRERTFTILELVAALEELDVEPSSDPVEHAERALALLDGRPRNVDAQWSPAEIGDPFGLAPQVQREIADRVHELTTRLARALFGVPPRG